MTTQADQFFAAWKQLESELRRRSRSAKWDEWDVASLLRRAREQHLITADVEDFLHGCRAARNAYAHVSFDGYSGPVAHPPAEVVKRLERIAATLKHPARAAAVAAPAIECKPGDELHSALALMSSRDFSQLPYQHPDLGWLLLTREQVSRWLESAADPDHTVLIDLRETVRSLADSSAVGPVRPTVLPHDTSVPSALDEIEHALRTADNLAGGYPAVLIESNRRSAASVRILTSDDLPHLYDLLGR